MSPALLQETFALTESQIDDLTHLFQQEWWTKARDRAGIVKLLEGSTVTLGLIAPDSGRLVAFARALSDGIYKTLIFDVIVSPEYRGTGIGKRLMEGLLGHQRLRNVQHAELYCLPDMEPFYRQWGFDGDVGGVRLLRRMAEKG